MKKIISGILFVSLVFCAQLLTAQTNELEKAISSLWQNGPDEKTQKTLESFVKSTDKSAAARAGFHLSCLKIINGTEDPEKLLPQLEAAATTEQEKNTLNNIREKIQMHKDRQMAESQKLPESFNQKVSLDFRDTDLREFAKILARQADCNIVVHSSIKKRATMALKDATIGQALDTLCELTDSRYENRNGIFVILPRSLKEDYSQAEYRLTSLSAARALKLLKAEIFPKSGNNAPENLSEDGIRKATLPQGVDISADGDKLTFGGSPEAVKKYVDMIRTIDLKDRAHKISIRIWHITSEKKIDLKDFSTMKESERGKIARIVSAPAMITLPNQSAKIEVESNDEAGQKKNSESLDFLVKARFSETGTENQIQVEMTSIVYGTSFLNGQSLQTNQNRDATLRVAPGAWITLPMYENGNSQLFLEFQITPHQN